MDDAALPRSVAIAGGWGYIGRRILDAAVELGLRVWVLDPGPVPEDLRASAVEVVADETAFYRLDADLYHLALHPEHRAGGRAALVDRAARRPLLALEEKPMAPPEEPSLCQAVAGAVEGTRMVLLYDFPELYDPMVHAIAGHLLRCERVEITEITLYRGKDREDPRRPRNHKRAVHIQYQESVHSLAFVLWLLGRLHGECDAVFADGIAVTARAEPYAPPNPGAYPFVVDGRCTYGIDVGGLRIEGRTDFKAGAETAKRTLIRGVADGRPFTIEADAQEGRKYLRIDGQDRGFAPDASTYRHILRTAWAWYLGVDGERLMSGVYPNPRFARFTYQLSALLWRSSWTGERLVLSSADEVLRFDAGFAAAAGGFPRYSRSR